MASPTLDASGAFNSTLTVHTVTSSTVAVTTTSTNDVIVIDVWIEGTTNPAPHVTNVTASGLTFAKRFASGSFAGHLGFTAFERWWAPSTATISALTVTVTYSATVDCPIIMGYGINGCANINSPWDSNVSLPAVNTNTGGTATTPTTLANVSTSQADDLILWSFCTSDTNTGKTIVPASYTITGTGFQNTSGTNDVGGNTARRAVSATQTNITVASATNNTINWICVADALTADATSAPQKNRDWPNPQTYPTYSDWYRWAETGNTNLPFPTPFFPYYDQSLPPRSYPRLTDYTWIDNGNSTLPRPTPFLPFDWPNPPRVSWYQSWTQPGIVTAVQSPFIQSDWPVPQRTTWYQTWVEPPNTQLPFPTPFLPQDQSLPPRGPQRLPDYFWSESGNVQLPFPTPFRPFDYPNPQRVTWYQDWHQSLNNFYQEETFPFSQKDWPNPLPVSWYRDWYQNLQQNTLRPAFQAPFYQTDWPLPRTAQPIDQTWIQNLVNTPGFISLNPFSIVWSGSPTTGPPFDETWTQNLQQTTLTPTTQLPFTQTFWPSFFFSPVMIIHNIPGR